MYKNCQNLTTPHSTAQLIGVWWIYDFCWIEQKKTMVTVVNLGSFMILALTVGKYFPLFVRLHLSFKFCRKLCIKLAKVAGCVLRSISGSLSNNVLQMLEVKCFFLLWFLSDWIYSCLSYLNQLWHCWSWFFLWFPCAQEVACYFLRVSFVCDFSDYPLFWKSFHKRYTWMKRQTVWCFQHYY